MAQQLGLRRLGLGKQIRLSLRTPARLPFRVDCSGQRRKKKPTGDAPTSVDGWLSLIRDETEPPLAPVDPVDKAPKTPSKSAKKMTRTKTGTPKPSAKQRKLAAVTPQPAPKESEEEVEAEDEEVGEDVYEEDEDADDDTFDPAEWRDSTAGYKMKDGSWVFDLPSDDRRHHSVLTDADMGNDPPGHKSGYVAIVGYPNAGKSTLINRLVGQKLSSVTYKPQTTRHRVVGFASGPEYQMILFDTPGILKQKRSKLEERMMQAVVSSIKDSEAIIAVVDASFKAKEALKLIQPGPDWDGPPMSVLLNKVDLVTPEETEELVQWYTEHCRAEKVFTSVALSGQGVDEIKQWAISKLPQGPTLYPKDLVSEQPERFFVSEIIREKIFLFYDKEVPYCSQVVIQEFKERPTAKDFICADIVVERDSQVPIILGKGGLLLRKLGQESRVDIEAFLGRPVYLELSVKVAKDWRDKDDSLRSFGYFDKTFI